MQHHSSLPLSFLTQFPCILSGRSSVVQRIKESTKNGVLKREQSQIFGVKVQLACMALDNKYKTAFYTQLPKNLFKTCHLGLIRVLGRQKISIRALNWINLLNGESEQKIYFALTTFSHYSHIFYQGPVRPTQRNIIYVRLIHI